MVGIRYSRRCVSGALIGAILISLLPLTSTRAQSPEALGPFVDSLAGELITTAVPPGMTIAIARDGEVVFARGYGQANVELRVPAGPETVYGIASVTKPFTAAAVLHLAARGELSLEEPITTYLPEYPTQGRHVTLHHLLNHTSGIRRFLEVNPELHVNREFRMNLSYEEMLELLADEPFEFEPGENYRYSGSGYYLLGEIVTRVAGIPFPDHVERELLRPHGLTASRFCPHRRIVPNRAAGYDYVYEDDRLVNAHFWNLPTFSPSTGGLCATASELVRWAHMLHTERVLEPASVERMTAPTVLAGGDTVAYGYGLHLDELGGHRRIWHGGANRGFTAILASYPDDALSIAVLTNSGEVREKAGELERTLARRLLGMPDLVITEAVVARYEGTYELEVGPRTLEVRVFGRDGHLIAQPAGQGPLRLLFQGDDTFVVEGETIRLVFTVDGDRAQQLTLYQGGRVFQGDRTH